MSAEHVRVSSEEVHELLLRELAGSLDEQLNNAEAGARMRVGLREQMSELALGLDALGTAAAAREHATFPVRFSVPTTLQGFLLVTQKLWTASVELIGVPRVRRSGFGVFLTEFHPDAARSLHAAGATPPRGAKLSVEDRREAQRAWLALSESERRALELRAERAFASDLRAHLARHPLHVVVPALKHDLTAVDLRSPSLTDVLGAGIRGRRVLSTVHTVGGPLGVEASLAGPFTLAFRPRPEGATKGSVAGEASVACTVTVGPA